MYITIEGVKYPDFFTGQNLIRNLLGGNLSFFFTRKSPVFQILIPSEYSRFRCISGFGMGEYWGTLQPPPLHKLLEEIEMLFIKLIRRQLQTYQRLYLRYFWSFLFITSTFRKKVNFYSYIDLKFQFLVKNKLFDATALHETNWCQ